MAGRPPLRGCCCCCGRGGGGEAAAAASSAASGGAPSAASGGAPSAASGAAPAPAAPASSSSMNGGGVRCGEGRPGPKELRGVGGWPEAEATRISSPPSGVRGEDEAEADDEEADEEADEDEASCGVCCGDGCGAGGTATGPPSGDREGAVAAAEVAAAGRSRSRLRRGDVAGASGPWGGMAAVGSSAVGGIWVGDVRDARCEVMRNAVPRPPKARHFSLFSFSFSS